MAREYGNRRSSRSRSGTPHQFLVITITFLLGYLTASVFDIETVSHWVNTQVLAHHEMKKELSEPEAKQASIPPKPKFEFYTLLTNEKTSKVNTHTTTSSQPTSTVNKAATASISSPTMKPISNNTVTVIPETITAAKQDTSTKLQQITVANQTQPKHGAVSSGKGNYLVQVASFKVRQDAEQMKGTLILKGFNVYIVPVSHPIKGNWFRVVVGPFPNRGLAQQAQLVLAKNEHLNGMVTNGG